MKESFSPPTAGRNVRFPPLWNVKLFEIAYTTHVIHANDKLNLLKTTALYGANASGKSNLISAMFFFEILFESTVNGLAGMYGISEKLVNNASYRKKVEKHLRLIDVGIKRLDVQTETVFDEHSGKNTEKKIVRTVHDMYDEFGNTTGEKLFNLRQESTGTLRFLTYIQNIVDMIAVGGVFIADEMSARLHPLLTKLIVDIFCSEENKKAQLIFTTHDISLLNNNQFRRDEVVFVDKNEYGESALYALSDLRIREDASFSKDYLQGKYGAIPIFNYNELTGGKSNG